MGWGAGGRAELKSKSASKSKSMGMQITAHRIKLMNELHGEETAVTIVDLVDSFGRGLWNTGRSNHGIITTC